MNGMALDPAQKLFELKQKPRKSSPPVSFQQEDPYRFTAPQRPPEEEEDDSMAGWLQAAVGVVELVGGILTVNPALIAKGVATTGGGVYRATT